MNYKSCDACVHSGKLFDQYPCRGCNSNHEPIDARVFRRIDLAETVDAWEPNELARALMRAGVDAAIAEIRNASFYGKVDVEQVIALLEAK